MIKVERDERVLKLVIDVPPVNVLDTAALSEIAAALGALDDDVSAVLIQGEGKCFSAGASVAEHQKEQAPAMIQALTDACLALTNAPVPTVALVHGACMGGALELAMFCDFVVADPDANFGVPEIQLAFFPPLACAQLAKQCGRQNAAHLIFSGASIDAQEAKQIGLVQKILVVDDWGKLAKRFNRLSQPVLRLAKKAFSLGSGSADEATIAQLNKLFLGELYETEDVYEGIASFTEKRRPEWKHQ